MPKPICLLHIGMHKTGSSSIQASLAALKPSQEVEFLSFTPSGNSSGIISSLFLENPEKYHGNVKRGFTKEQIIKINEQNFKKIESAINLSKAKHVVISAEDISTLPEASVYKLSDWLMQWCGAIRIIAYVRPPIGFIESAIQQYIKGGNTKISILRIYPNYKNNFEKFDKIFGTNNVELVKFDSSSLFNNDVVADFCKRINFDIKRECIKRVNDSISLEAAALLYLYYTFGPGYGSFEAANKENSRLLKVISQIGNKKLRLSAETSNTILQDHIDDIQWMEKRLGCSLTEQVSESIDTISDLNDLIPLAIQNAPELIDLLISTFHKQKPTPQELAGWIQILRQQLSN